MAFSFTLAQAYLAKEYSRGAPSAVRILGTLLDSAFARPATSGEFETLLRRLDKAAAR